MIEYIKEYGISVEDYNRIISSLRPEFIELLDVSRYQVSQNLTLFREIGADLVNIIMLRPDLLLIPTDNIKNVINKFDRRVLNDLISNQIDNLVVIGV